MPKEIIIGKKEYFPNIERIKYEGPDSKNPLAFCYYDAEKVIRGKKMKDHFRFATAYWHTFCGTGGDPFGPGTKKYPWSSSSDPMKAAKEKLMRHLNFLQN